MRLCAVGKGGRIGPIGREIVRKLLFSKEYALKQVGGPKSRSDVNRDGACCDCMDR